MKIIQPIYDQDRGWRNPAAASTRPSGRSVINLSCNRQTASSHPVVSILFFYNSAAATSGSAASTATTGVGSLGSFAVE